MPAAARSSKPILAARFKTQLCAQHAANGACSYGDRCMFAHGEDDLRTKEQNLADGLVKENSIHAFRRRAAAAERRTRSESEPSSPTDAPDSAKADASLPLDDSTRRASGSLPGSALSTPVVSGSFGPLLAMTAPAAAINATPAVPQRAADPVVRLTPDYGAMRGKPPATPASAPVSPLLSDPWSRSGGAASIAGPLPVVHGTPAASSATSAPTAQSFATTWSPFQAGASPSGSPSAIPSGSMTAAPQQLNAHGCPPCAPAGCARSPTVDWAPVAAPHAAFPPMQAPHMPSPAAPDRDAAAARNAQHRIGASPTAGAGQLHYPVFAPPGSDQAPPAAPMLLPPPLNGPPSAFVWVLDPQHGMVQLPSPGQS